MRLLDICYTFRYARGWMGEVARRSGGPLVGFDAAHLDAQIARYVRIAERNAQTVEELGPQLAAKVKAEIGGLDAEATSIIYDRLVKADLNLVKATDELARLRSFMSGGPDSRPDLSSLSEIELRGVVIGLLRAIGPDEARQLVELAVKENG